MDRDELVNKRVLAIAKTHKCTVADVHSALDRHPIEVDRDAFLKRTLALELVRLDELEAAFEAKALRDSDVPAGVLMVKIAERRATLLGLNAPIGHAVQVVQHEPAEHLTSTQQLRKVLDNLRNPAFMSPENRERAARAAEERAKFLRGERAADPDED